MDNLIKYINTIAVLDEKATNALYAYASIEEFEKNEFILETNQYCNKIWYLDKGMVRKFHLVDGKEVTSWIHTEGEIFTSLQSYAKHSRSEEYLQTCEATRVIGISKTNSEKLSQHPQFIQFTNQLMEQQFVNIDANTKALNQRDARGKYEYLAQIAPEIIKRAKLGHIASILGITQETLSRIRKQL